MKLKNMNELLKVVRQNTDYCKNSGDHKILSGKYSFSIFDAEKFTEYIEITGFPVIENKNEYIPLIGFKNYNLNEIRIFRILNSILTPEHHLYMLNYEFEKFGLKNPVITAELIKYYNSEVGSSGLHEYMKFNNIKPVKENLEFFLWLADETEYVKKMLIETNLSKDIIELLRNLSREIQIFLLELFVKINLSLNDKKHAVNYIFDLVQSGKTDIEKIINEINCLTFEKQTAPVKILDYLKKLRFPVLSGLILEKDEIVNKLNTGKIKFEYDKTFESPGISCKIKLEKSEDTETIIEYFREKKFLIEKFLDVNEQKLF
ncbi:hypothetical protein KA977_10370 [Candidatus Dependentiae bacterium]|nr:hypothetical protein [Candidatus Dependentiae bacterium]